MQHCAFAVNIWLYLVDIFFGGWGGGRFLVKRHWPPCRSDNTSVLVRIYIVHGKPCVVVQRPHSLLEFPKLPAQLLTFYHSCFAPTQGISWEKRAWCDLKDSLVGESGTCRKMNDIELADGKKNCTQLSVMFVYHQAHHTGWNWRV